MGGKKGGAIGGNCFKQEMNSMKGLSIASACHEKGDPGSLSNDAM
jgi:hypothetical protein